MEHGSPHYIGLLTAAAVIISSIAVPAFRKNLFGKPRGRIFRYLLPAFCGVLGLLGNGDYSVHASGRLQFPEGKWTEKHLQSALAVAHSPDFLRYHAKRHGLKETFNSSDVETLGRAFVKREKHKRRIRGRSVSIIWEIRCKQWAIVALFKKRNCTPHDSRIKFTYDLFTKYIDELYWIEYYRASTSSADSIKALQNVTFIQPDAAGWVLPYLRRFHEDAVNEQVHSRLNAIIARASKN